MLSRRFLGLVKQHHAAFWRLTRSQQRCLHLHLQTEPVVTLEYKHSIAVIHMDNKRENQINPAFLKEFYSVLDSVEKDTTLKGLVTVGEGKFYSNGFDLDWLATMSPQEVLDFVALFQNVVLKVLMLPFPTLAVLNGHAYGGGAVLAFAHDLRTMNAEKGWICFNEVHLNKVFSSFLMEFLRIKLGDGKNVSEALLLGRRYTGPEALQNDLVHSIHSKLSLLDESVVILESFVGKNGIPHEGFLNMKKDIYKTAVEAYEKESKESQPFFSLQFLTDIQIASLKRKR